MDRVYTPADDSIDYTFDFSKALELIKSGKVVSRKVWGTNINCRLQKPSYEGKMNLPYIYMTKHRKEQYPLVFPISLSCESIMANDWIEV